MTNSEQKPSRRKAVKKGLVIVNTGDGKGKTTAALGLALRAAGNGLRVLIIQFIKGRWKTGESQSLPQLEPNIQLVRMGMGFTIERLRDPRVPMTDHHLAARAAFEIAREAVASGRYRMVVLDEVLGSIKAGLVTEREVLELAASRPADLHLVLTGRGATPAIVEAADLVTEMRDVKHHHRAGVPAQRGIEF